MHADLEQIVRVFEPVLAPLSAVRCQMHPGDDPARWSVQQNIGHLVLTYKSTTHLLQKRLDAGEPLHRRPTWKEWIPRTVVIGLGIFPKGQSAPSFTRPDLLAWPEKSGTELIGALHAGLGPLDSVLAACEARFGSRPVGAHFIFGPLTAGQWRRFHRVHGRLHLGQIRDVVAMLSGSYL